MSRNNAPQLGTEAYHEDVHGLDANHPDFWPVTLGTIGKVALGVGLAVTVAWNAAGTEPAQRPTNRPAYEVPHNPVIDGQLPSLPPSPAPTATDIPYRTNP